jgi:hypothetical protein
LRTFERQISLGPGRFANFADVAFIGANSDTTALFASFKDNGDAFNPRFSLDPVSADIKLGNLQPGDTVSYVYQLTAQGTTHGEEQGYVAFLGDPFGLEATSGNLVLSIASVPEPAAWIPCVIGFVGVAVARGGRRHAARLARSSRGMEAPSRDPSISDRD